MKYLWLTDIHLNFLSNQEIKNFAHALNKHQANGILITGDLSTGSKIVEDFSNFLGEVELPTYFILGNHDFYRASFKKTEEAVLQLIQKFPNAYYLPSISTALELAPGIGIVGQNGWYDARWLEPLSRLVFLYDFSLIQDFKELPSYKDKLSLARDKAFEAADKAAVSLRLAFKQYQTVYFLTHFPPWPQATPYQNPWIQKFWVPYSTSKIMAEILQYLMDDFPDRNLIVLAGHTHQTKNYTPVTNIQVKVGRATFGQPVLQSIIDL